LEPHSPRYPSAGSTVRCSVTTTAVVPRVNQEPLRTVLVSFESLSTEIIVDPRGLRRHASYRIPACPFLERLRDAQRPNSYNGRRLIRHTDPPPSRLECLGAPAACGMIEGARLLGVFAPIASHALFDHVCISSQATVIRTLPD
jgi:hypothetical protein